MKIKTKDDRRHRIQLRQRKRLSGTEERPRLSVFRSLTHIYAQVIDDMSGKTLVSASSIEPALKGTFSKEVRGGNLKGAEAIGKTIAERSLEKGIKRVVFDRSGFLYHGRIRAVADAARKAGLEF
jgi:large subunit ribosomal protein L18